MKQILFYVLLMTSAVAHAHDCSTVLSGQALDNEKAYNEIVLPFYKTIHTDRFRERYLRQLAEQTAKHTEVTAKLKELTESDRYDDKRKIDFLHAFAAGASDLESYILTHARLELLEWLKSYAMGGPGPHYFGPGIGYQLRFQAPKLFPEITEQLKTVKGFESFEILERLEEILEKSEYSARPLARLRLAIDPSIHADDMIGVFIRIFLPDQRVLDFTVKLRLKFNPGGRESLYGLNEAEVLDLAYHEYEPTDGDAFLKGPSIVLPLKTLVSKDSQSNFDQVLVERESSDSISIRLFNKGIQYGIGSMILPLVEERTGLKVYRREFKFGVRNLWQKRIFEVRHNLWANTLEVRIDGVWLGVTFASRTAQFQ